MGGILQKKNTVSMRMNVLATRAKVAVPTARSMTALGMHSLSRSVQLDSPLTKYSPKQSFQFRHHRRLASDRPLCYASAANCHGKETPILSFMPASAANRRINFLCAFLVVTILILRRSRKTSSLLIDSKMVMCLLSIGERSQRCNTSIVCCAE